MCFYSIILKFECKTLYENLTYERMIPIDYIPIACDSFGNNILLCLNPHKYEKNTKPAPIYPILLINLASSLSLIFNGVSGCFSCSYGSCS